MLTKKQIQARKQKQQQEEAAKARLAKQLGRNADGSLPKAAKKKDDGSSLKLDYRTSDVGHLPSAERNEIEPEAYFLVDGVDWEQRKKAAALETEHKKKCTAPLYSKGPYQFITDAADLTTLGRKV
jgi:hypothetical protein|uniref:Uncharacterized protein n=1 Tax=Myoviridae sp. ctshb19 TaxID=2825194 RepID=A0A8S5UGE3_9CAUD|nr:MAG TPA: hypothetical protein [Myoviridae sp. ctshb19]